MSDTSHEGAGWVGNWSPGIGDPTWVGWLTVVLYLVAAYAAFRLVQKRGDELGSAELWFWRGLTLLLLALGINKQLDLQTAFTELGRILARQEGWYDRRAGVQRMFIVGIALLSAASFFGLTFFLRRTPSSTRLTLLGIASLLFFVVVRAASFHHVDRFLGTSALGVRWNWTLEIGGISVVWLGTLRRSLTEAGSAVTPVNAVGEPRA